MTQSEYEAEVHFRLCKSIFATLAIRGIIGEDDLHILLRAAAEKYRAQLANWRRTALRSTRITWVEFPARTISPKQPPPTKRVAAYARVSTMKDAQENSLQSYQEYFTEYIQRHPGWVFAGMYTDDGISGLSIRKRDGFNRMVADALDGKIDLIIAKSLSRFARNTVDAFTTIRSLKAAGVAVYFQKENINAMDSAGEFLITLMSSFAEEESRSISENVTWAVRHRYAQGIYRLPGLLLGYQRIQDGEIQVDESGARVVRFIYLLALTGKSSTDICRILMDYGIPPPRAGPSVGTAHHTQHSEKRKIYGRCHPPKRDYRGFPDKNQKTKRGRSAAILCGERTSLYRQQVGVAGQEVQATWTDAIRRNCTFSPIANKVICGDCGGRYGRKTWHSTTYNDTVWECNNRKNGRTKCRCHHIYAEELDAAVQRGMRHLMKVHADILDMCSNLLEHTLGGITPDIRSALDDIARGKPDIHIDGLMIRILIRKMVVTSKQTLVIHFLDGSVYRHRLGATPRGKRLYNAQRDHSRILALHAVGCSAKEISQQLGISVNTVRSFLRRNLKRIPVTEKTEQDAIL